MIGHLNKLVVVLFLSTACANNSEKGCEECESEIDSTELILSSPELDEAKMGQFLDLALVPDAEIYYQSEETYTDVTIDGQDYEIMSYEGLFVEASIGSSGGTFFFKPYDYYDENLEMEVKSEFNFSLSLNLSADQLNQLSYTERNSETNNIKWDFFENLFTVYFYLDEDQNNLPLKFIDSGKTEWDG